MKVLLIPLAGFAALLLHSGIHWQVPDTSSLTLSWQTLAAMASVSSVIVVAGMAYLRATFGKELNSAKFEISDRVRADIDRALMPVDKRIEKLESKLEIRQATLEDRQNRWEDRQQEKPD